MSRMIAELFQKAQKIQSQIADMRQRLAAHRVEAVSPDGAVKVVASGDKQIVSIEIQEEFQRSPDVAKVVAETSNEALKKAEIKLKEELNAALESAGIHLPGLF